MANGYFPFHALGYCCNPFRSLTREEWFQIATLPQPIQELLGQEFTHLQIIGEQGAGKTSALMALKKFYFEQGRSVHYHYLPPGQGRRSWRWGDGEILLIDEMQRLTHNQRLRVVKRITAKDKQNPQLIFSSHEDLSPLFQSQSCPLQTILLHKQTTALVRQIIERRLRFFSLHKSSKTSFTAQSYRLLNEIFADDLRAMEKFLYEFFQGQRFESEITDEALRANLQQTIIIPARE